MELAAEVHVRLATAADLSDLLLCDSFAGSSERRRADLDAWCRNGSILLAESEGSALGFAVLEHSLFGHGFVPLVCTRESSRGQGVASLLLAAAGNRCRTGKLFTSANRSNVAAQALFAHAGFVPSGTIENLDAGDPELVFYKAVTQHDA